MKVLAVGAHPDDIEIGAAAFLMKLVDAGHEVFLVILTEDSEPEVRRAEAVAAAQVIGIASDSVGFLGFRDGFLSADRETVSRLRAHMEKYGVKPDFVITHTMADSHNDHRAANATVRAAFRDTPILEFPIHVSIEPDHFAPRIFTHIDRSLDIRKAKVLQCFTSQQERIKRSDLNEFEAQLGGLAQIERAEAFALELPGSSAATSSKLLELSDSSFHRLWYPILGEGRLTLLYESYERPGSEIDWPTGDEGIGRDKLRDAFSAQWIPTSPLIERPSGGADVLSQLRQLGHLLLVGGALSNRVTRDVYNRLDSSRFVVEYELPRKNLAYLLDKRTGRRTLVEQGEGGDVRRDVGVLSKVRNPYVDDQWILCAAGATSLATRRALEALAKPWGNGIPFGDLATGEAVEIPFSCGVDSPGVEVLDIG